MMKRRMSSSAVGNVEAEETTDESPEISSRGTRVRIDSALGWHVNFIVSGDRREGREGEGNRGRQRAISRLVERVKMNICKSLSNLRAARGPFHDEH